MSCPLCDKIHEIEEKKKITTITLKGKGVSYEKRFYFCAKLLKMRINLKLEQ